MVYSAPEEEANDSNGNNGHPPGPGQNWPQFTLLVIVNAFVGPWWAWSARPFSSYPGVWGISQLFTGALSDRLGRKWLIVAGMWTQATGIGLLMGGRVFGVWLGGVVLLGLGTAMVYPTLLAAVSDVAHPEWRGAAVGVYRLWRDGGYALGRSLRGCWPMPWECPLRLPSLAD